MYRKLLASAALNLFTLGVNASQIIHLEVDQKADVYEVRVEMVVDAPAADVRAVLTDYANLDRLNGSITASSVIDSESAGTVRVLTRIENCVLFFCTQVQKVEDVTQDRQGRIMVVIVPDASSFRSGHATWELQSTGNTTLVIHHAKMEPAIQVPPLIGPALIKNTLRREIRESFENIDCLARNQCASPSGSSHELIFEM